MVEKQLEPNGSTTAAAATEETPTSFEFNQLPLKERKKLAQNALRLGKLTIDDISKTYGLKRRTVSSMKGWLVSQGKEPPKEEDGHEEKEPPAPKVSSVPRVVVVRSSTGRQPRENGDARDQRIESLEQSITEMKDMLATSGRIIARPPEEIERMGADIEDAFQRNLELIAIPIVQKVLTNPKVLMYFDYVKAEEGYKGDFGDLANECIEYFMKKHDIEIEVRRKVG